VKTFFDQAVCADLHRYSLNGQTMGTRYTAVFYAPAGLDTTAVGASLFAAVNKVDRQMSTYNPASDVCRLNAAPINDWIAVPTELLDVLETGLQVTLESNGAFDMAIGDLVQAWGFGPSPRASLPQLAAAQKSTYCPATTATLNVNRASHQVRKRAPMAIDLCGIAKGYGVDQLSQCLDSWKIASYLVGIDGEMRARGVKPDGVAWSVAIEKPTYDVREVSGVMELQGVAIATSGDYRHWVDMAGKRFAHTMNPKLRQPVSNRLAAVTVLAPTCVLADAWATALLVLGEDAGLSLAQSRSIDALFVLREGDQLKEVWIIDGNRH
jgi:FAD:protein FMN transferase